MISKKLSRLRRARRTRSKIRELGVVRLSFHKSNQHLYAQLTEFQPGSDKVLSTLSTRTKSLGISGKNAESAGKLGEAIAKQAKELGITKVGFDRGGNSYHGRVKQFAEAARSSGLEF